MAEHLQYTSLLIRSLYQHGVRHAIISPGSRSTPLTIAAAIHPGIDKKVVLDERSAAFIALGIGKKTGKPAVLICTSGTALANYFPAVIEARESGVPMIILSADRPPAFRGIGSSQTIDQLNIFGNRVHYFHEVGEPVSMLPDIKRIHALGRQAVDIATTRGGAVHINFPFRKPLEPTKEQLNMEIQLSEKQFMDPPKAEGALTRRVLQLNTTILSLMDASERPLVICGPSDPARSLQRLARKAAVLLNSPFIAEPGSSMDYQDGDMIRFEQYLGNPKLLSDLKPDLILRFGDQPFTKSLLTALESWSDVLTIHFNAREEMQDHTLSVDYQVRCEPIDEIDLSEIDKGNSHKWLSKWKENDQQSNIKLSDAVTSEAVLTDGHIFHHLSSTLDQNWNIMLSNSFPARDMALFGRHEMNQLVNRGAAGIDGILSTAIGQHIAGSQPTCCIIGDLAFLHDSNALLSLHEFTHPFIVIVINNGGGTIFRMLPVANMEPKHDRDDLYKIYFETPQQSEFMKLAEANGIDFIRISNLDELKKLDLNEIQDRCIIECVTDADASISMRKNLWQR